MLTHLCGWPCPPVQTLTHSFKLSLIVLYSHSNSLWLARPLSSRALNPEPESAALNPDETNHATAGGVLCGPAGIGGAASGRGRGGTGADAGGAGRNAGHLRPQTAGAPTILRLFALMTSRNSNCGSVLAEEDASRLPAPAPGAETLNPRRACSARAATSEHLSVSKRLLPRQQRRAAAGGELRPHNCRWDARLSHHLGHGVATFRRS